MANDPAAIKDLAPTGTLRIGVVSAPSKSTFFVVKRADGEPDGVTVDLGRALGRKLGLPVVFTVAPNSGEITEATKSGALDVAFMPVDDVRKALVDFGPAYVIAANTYLVTATSGIASIPDVDRPGIRVVGITGTTTVRTAGRQLKQATVIATPSVDEAIAMLRDGRADAFALVRDALLPLAPMVPGSRILDGAFHRIPTAVAVPKGRPRALDLVTQFMRAAKADGTVRHALDAAGYPGVAVAPDGED